MYLLIKSLEKTWLSVALKNCLWGIQKQSIRTKLKKILFYDFSGKKIAKTNLKSNKMRFYVY